MKKKIGISILFLAIIIGGVYFYIKFNPPLEIGTLASSTDNKSIVIGVGNKGFREVRIVDVSVNNDEKPMKTKLQVSNALQGFIIADDDTDEKAKKYGFTNINNAAIKTGTSPSSSFEKSDSGTATENDEIYGISIFHNEEVMEIEIKYSYLGLSFDETVTFH